MPVERAARSADELALLRAVLADPADLTPALIYGDWLDDHGDPRGGFLLDFLRAFEAAATLPPDPPDLPRAWAEVLALPIRRRLREGFAPLRPYLGAILRGARPTIRMTIGPAEPMADFPIGTTRAAGLPDLPAGSPWPAGAPTFETARQPTEFLLQINLADLSGTLADGLLPPAGLLSVFREMDNATLSRRVLFTPPGVPLVRPPATGPAGEPPPFPADVSYPLGLADGLRESFRHPDLPDNLWQSGRDGSSPLVGRLFDDRPDGPRRRAHYLCTSCGPDLCWVLDDVVGETREAYLELMELASGDEPRWTFGDGDRLHLFVPAEDARRGVFGRAASEEI